MFFLRKCQLITLNKAEQHALISGSGTTAFSLTADSNTDPDPAFSWASDDTDVATVASGAVKTLTVGKAVITASASGYRSASCDVYSHDLDYDTTDTCTAGETYKWTIAYDDGEVDIPQIPIVISDIVAPEGVTATAGTYDAEHGSITISVAIPAAAVASSEIEISAKATVGANYATAGITLTVDE